MLRLVCSTPALKGGNDLHALLAAFPERNDLRVALAEARLTHGFESDALDRGPYPGVALS